MARCRAACLALLPVLLWAVPAFAQTRPSAIPENSSRGYIRPVDEMAVTVDDQAMQLAAGAIIRDQQNLIIVPVTIPRERAWAAYHLDRDAQAFRLWLLPPLALLRPRP